jgi:tight adherence protein C
MGEQRLKAVHFVLDTAQMLSVIGLGTAFGLFSLWIINGPLARLLGEPEPGGASENFLRTLRRVALTRLDEFNKQRFSPAYLAVITEQIVIAGDPAELTAGEYMAARELGASLLGIFGFLLCFIIDRSYLWAVAFAVTGWFLPFFWLRDQITKRHHAITRALPYNLDLLTLSVEAGLDFAQAVGKVVEKGRQGPLVEEFRLVLKNIKLGKTREDALRGMSTRVQLPSLTSFTNALIQADRMGTSLGKILRIQATQLRIERTNRAEKLAYEAPVKMLFPLIFFIFPAVFCVLFGPIIYQTMNQGP